MCGICGIINHGLSADVSEDILLRMCAEMKHRGPDDQGVYIKNSEGLQVGLGHRRLSIIDLSSAGHQPMTNEDGSVWLVFNGEVYNYQELRIDLLRRSHIFQSSTDAETVIHLYEEYGEECVKYLRGMFAFALWDHTNKKLLLARDRPGKKPLLYCQMNGKFCFASEFSALLASGLVEKKIRPLSLDHYLAYGYVPAPFTIYENIFKLPPGHRLVLEDNTVKISSYWMLDYSEKLCITEEEASQEILRLLKESVKIRMYSDVPLGAFLSGGTDSSTVVALMNEFSERPVKTFTIGFEDASYSELKYARKIAEKFHTDHHELIVQPKALEVLPLLVERYGEPYADSSCIPTYHVSRETKRYVTVALNGDGGDESFAGYERYQAMIAAEWLKKTPGLFQSGLRKFSKLIPDSVDAKNRLRRIKRFFEANFLPYHKRYEKWVGVFDETSRRLIYSSEFRKILPEIEAGVVLEPFLLGDRSLHVLDHLLNTDVHTYLPNDLLVKVDITSMANSLEARSPFLDHKLMEFMARLPASYKMKWFIKKYILKKTIKGIIPKKNIHRKKMGFGIPVGEWFRHELRELLNETLLSSKSLKRGYFKPDLIQEMVHLHIMRKRDYTHQLWALLMLELWHQRFMD